MNDILLDNFIKENFLLALNNLGLYDIPSHPFLLPEEIGEL